MRNLFVLFSAAVCLFVVLGWFFGWYRVVDIQSNGGTHRLQIDVDTNKIRADFDRGQARLRETLDRLRQVAEEPPPAEEAKSVVVRDDEEKTDQP